MLILETFLEASQQFMVNKSIFASQVIHSWRLGSQCSRRPRKAEDGAEALSSAIGAGPEELCVAEMASKSIVVVVQISTNDWLMIVYTNG